MAEVYSEAQPLNSQQPGNTVARGQYATIPSGTHPSDLTSSSELHLLNFLLPQIVP